jgi:hypothetical protein
MNTDSLARVNARMRAALDDYTTGERAKWKNNFLSSLQELKRMANEEKNVIHVSSARVTPAERQFNMRHDQWMRSETCNALGDAHSMLGCNARMPTDPSSCKSTNNAMISMGCSVIPRNS